MTQPFDVYDCRVFIELSHRQILINGVEKSLKEAGIEAQRHESEFGNSLFEISWHFAEGYCTAMSSPDAGVTFMTIAGLDTEKLAKLDVALNEAFEGIIDNAENKRIKDEDEDESED